MKIFKTVLMLCASLCALLPHPTTAQAQVRQQGGRVPPNQVRPNQVRPNQPANPKQAARRDALEMQVLNRFVKRASDEISLDGPQRDRLMEVLRNSSARRRQLTQRTNELHRQFQVAIRDPATPQETFARLLADHQQLRRDEQQITDAEQADLRGFLTPRQQAHFLMLWIRLQENARAVQAQMPPGTPPGMPPGR
jgi:hypothetical protein